MVKSNVIWPGVMGEVQEVVSGLGRCEHVRDDRGDWEGMALLLGLQEMLSGGSFIR